MEIIQQMYSRKDGWRTMTGAESGILPDLILAFGDHDLVTDAEIFKTIRNTYPNATILCSSTAGSIRERGIYDDAIILTGIRFEKSRVRAAKVTVSEPGSSFKSGLEIAGQLAGDDLTHVFLVAAGRTLNAGELIRGVTAGLGDATPVTGGLAGNGYVFDGAVVGLDGVPEEGQTVAIAFYGQHLEVTCGHASGWEAFGTNRHITHAEGNILYELDGKPALDVYRLYLGEYVSELPGSALLFPLEIKVPGSDDAVIRTVISVDEGRGSLTFAGNIHEGSYARLMRSNPEALISAASSSAAQCLSGSRRTPDLAILISCVGRRMVLHQRTEEEVEAVNEVLGSGTVMTGFYSYGEISPTGRRTVSGLLNQTMTITTLTELQTK